MLGQRNLPIISNELQIKLANNNMLMKIKMIFKGLLIYFLLSGSSIAQDIEVIVHDTVLYDTLGADIAFHFDVVNISNEIQTVFLIRTINDLPDTNWTSSLCFGVNCFAPFVDSVFTGPPFTDPPLNPGDTLKASVHVVPLSVQGTANVQAQVGTVGNPDYRRTMDFIATTIPTVVENDLIKPEEYYLAQNYPNPFNPTTSIRYGIKEAGTVSLKIYDILGNDVATLVDEYKPAGNFEVNFKSNHLSS